MHVHFSEFDILIADGGPHNRSVSLLSRVQNLHALVSPDGGDERCYIRSEEKIGRFSLKRIQLGLH